MSDVFLKKPDKGLLATKGGGLGHVRGIQRQKEEETARHWDEHERALDSKEPQEEAKKPDVTVTITNLKWDRAQAAIGTKVYAVMDIEIPPAKSDITRVQCTVNQVMANGKWEPLKTEACHAEKGKARCELILPDPKKDKDGTVPAKPIYHITAKHLYSDEAKGGRLEALPGSSENPFDSVVFYSPARGDYLLFETEEEFQSLLPEIEKLAGLKGKTRQILEATDDSLRRKLQDEIDKETAELFESEVIGEADVMEELLSVRRNPRWGKTSGWVYVRAHDKKNGAQISRYRRSHSDKTLKKNLEELLKLAPGSKEHSPLFDTEFKLKLFKTDPLRSQAFLWSDSHKKEGTIAGQSFIFSKEAAVCRFAMNWDGAGGEIDLKDRKFQIGGGGSMSFGLLEGKAEGKFAFPEKGVNLLDFLKRTTPLAPVLSKQRVCLLRLQTTLSSKAFAGLTISGALNLLQLDLSKEKLAKKGRGKGATATSGVSVGGFAGAQVSACLEVAAEWARKADAPFAGLGSCGGEVGVSAGAGGDAKWELVYQGGVLRFNGSAALTVGLGCKGGVSFELSLEEGLHFMGHLFQCMDFHYVEEVRKEAFEFYKNAWFTLMTQGHAAFTGSQAMVRDVITSFSSWLGDLGNELEKAKRTLKESSTASATLANVPPEALGQALVTIMESREPSDFKSIMTILYSTLRRDANADADKSANHKLKWTLRCASGIFIPDQDGPDTEPKKEEALKVGIRKIEDFGLGIGYVDAKNRPQQRNEPFLREFQDMLKRNGLG